MLSAPISECATTARAPTVSMLRGNRSTGTRRRTRPLWSPTATSRASASAVTSTSGSSRDASASARGARASDAAATRKLRRSTPPLRGRHPTASGYPRPVSTDGTATHLAADDLPPLVVRAVEAARVAGFANSCRPAFGRLLWLLANGIGEGRIGETGTGCGVGLAWMATAAAPGARLISVEQDGDRAAIAEELFADDARVTTLAGGWQALEEHVPFDLLFLDGGGQGKRGTAPIDPAEWLNP